MGYRRKEPAHSSLIVGNIYSKVRLSKFKKGQEEERDFCPEWEAGLQNCKFPSTFLHCLMFRNMDKSLRKCQKIYDPLVN